MPRRLAIRVRTIDSESIWFLIPDLEAPSILRMPISLNLSLDRAEARLI